MFLTVLAGSLVLGTPLPGQDQDEVPAEKTAAPEGDEATFVADEAVPQKRTWQGFLRQLEEKHAETTTVRASFDQLRVDPNFLDEVRSAGTFLYEAPSRFRADYAGDKGGVSGSTIWIVEDKFWHYVPEIKQVDVATLPKGDSASVNQILLGFGVKTEKILEFFSVRMLEEDVPEGRTRLEFKSLDRDKTLQYDRVEITFDDRTLLPESLLLFDIDSETTLTLRGIELNTPIPADTFKVTLPPDTEIIDRSTAPVRIDLQGP